MLNLCLFPKYLLDIFKAKTVIVNCVRIFWIQFTYSKEVIEISLGYWKFPEMLLWKENLEYCMNTKSICCQKYFLCMKWNSMSFYISILYFCFSLNYKSKVHNEKNVYFLWNLLWQIILFLVYIYNDKRHLWGLNNR